MSSCCYEIKRVYHFILWVYKLLYSTLIPICGWLLTALFLVHLINGCLCVIFFRKDFITYLSWIRSQQAESTAQMLSRSQKRNWAGQPIKGQTAWTHIQSEETEATLVCVRVCVIPEVQARLLVIKGRHYLSQPVTASEWMCECV